MVPAARAAVKLLVAVAAMPLSVLAAHLVDAHAAFEIACGVAFMVALACAFLSLLDLRRALLEVERAHWLARALRTLIALPQAAVGMAALCSGVAIMGWVLYNSFVERLPAYSGGFLTFGLSGTLAAFGFGLLRGALPRRVRPGGRPPVP